MAVTHDGFEYTRYGDGYLTRKEGTTDEWGTVVGELPAPVVEQFAIVNAAKEGRLKRGRPNGVGAGRVDSQGVKQNPKVDAAAEKLGITPTEFRQWLNDDQPHVTRERIPEKDLDAIAKDFGMTPQEIRDRFAGRHAG